MGTKFGGGSLRSEINVTPLVDVVLVLLIIFMVVGPLIEHERATLPQTSNPAQMPRDGEQLDLSVTADGTIFLGDDWIPAGQLLAVLTAAHQRGPEQRVVIKADHRLRYADVRRVLQTVERSGFPGAGLATHRKPVAN